MFWKSDDAEIGNSLKVSKNLRNVSNEILERILNIRKISFLHKHLNNSNKQLGFLKIKLLLVGEK